jgi:hypothetical protein
MSDEIKKPEVVNPEEVTQLDQKALDTVVGGAEAKTTTPGPFLQAGTKGKHFQEAEITLD